MDFILKNGFFFLFLVIGASIFAANDWQPDRAVWYAGIFLGAISGTALNYIAWRTRRPEDGSTPLPLYLPMIILMIAVGAMMFVAEPALKSGLGIGFVVVNLYYWRPGGNTVKYFHGRRK